MRSSGIWAKISSSLRGEPPNTRGVYVGVLTVKECIEFFLLVYVCMPIARSSLEKKKKVLRAFQY